MNERVKAHFAVTSFYFPLYSCQNYTCAKQHKNYFIAFLQMRSRFATNKRDNNIIQYIIEFYIIII